MIYGFSIGNFFIAYYGCMIATGVLVAGIVGLSLVRQNHLDSMDFILLAAYAGLFGILGAKGLYLYVSRGLIDWTKMSDLIYLSSWMNGGFVFFGGLLGGLTGLLFAKKIHQIDVLTYLELCIPCLPVVHGFGRIGCLLASCCYGIPYHGPLAIVYQHSLYAPNNVSLFPVQGVEAIFNFTLAIFLIYFIKRRGKSIHTLYLYLVCYAIGRFGLEFLRYDVWERGMIGDLSTSQWISIGLLCAVLIYHISTRPGNYH